MYMIENFFLNNPQIYRALSSGVVIAIGVTIGITIGILIGFYFGRIYQHAHFPKKLKQLGKLKRTLKEYELALLSREQDIEYSLNLVKQTSAELESVVHKWRKK